MYLWQAMYLAQVVILFLYIMSDDFTITEDNTDIFS
jgi:hypothetical protein